jgi:hypothetical protein
MSLTGQTKNTAHNKGFAVAGASASQALLYNVQVQ